MSLLTLPVVGEKEWARLPPLGQFDPAKGSRKHGGASAFEDRRQTFVETLEK